MLVKKLNVFLFYLLYFYNYSFVQFLVYLFFLLAQFIYCHHFFLHIKFYLFGFVGFKFNKLFHFFKGSSVVFSNFNYNSIYYLISSKFIFINQLYCWLIFFFVKCFNINNYKLVKNFKSVNFIWLHLKAWAYKFYGFVNKFLFFKLYLLSFFNLTILKLHQIKFNSLILLNYYDYYFFNKFSFFNWFQYWICIYFKLAYLLVNYCFKLFIVWDLFNNLIKKKNFYSNSKNLLNKFSKGLLFDNIRFELLYKWWTKLKVFSGINKFKQVNFSLFKWCYWDKLMILFQLWVTWLFSNFTKWFGMFPKLFFVHCNWQPMLSKLFQTMSWLCGSYYYYGKVWPIGLFTANYRAWSKWEFRLLKYKFYWFSKWNTPVYDLWLNFLEHPGGLRWQWNLNLFWLLPDICITTNNDINEAFIWEVLLTKIPLVILTDNFTKKIKKFTLDKSLSQVNMIYWFPINYNKSLNVMSSENLILFYFFFKYFISLWLLLNKIYKKALNNNIDVISYNDQDLLFNNSRGFLLWQSLRNLQFWNMRTKFMLWVNKDMWTWFWLSRIFNINSIYFWSRIRY